MKFFFSLLNVYCCKLHLERLWLHFIQHGHLRKGSLNKDVAMRILDDAREIEK